VVQLWNAIRLRSAARSKLVILFGGVTMLAGAAIYLMLMMPGFTAVAATISPEEKERALAASLEVGTLPFRTGLIVGGVLCLLGGVTRGLFRTER
jgi:NaMN:DMB phosphoribosyltransferase